MGSIFSSVVPVAPAAKSGGFQPSWLSLCCVDMVQYKIFFLHLGPPNHNGACMYGKCTKTGPKLRPANHGVLNAQNDNESTFKNASTQSDWFELPLAPLRIRGAFANSCLDCT